MDRRRLLGRWTAALGIGLMAITGCTTTGATSTPIGGGGQERTQEQTAPVAEPARLTARPTAGATGVGPVEPVSMAVENGTLESVALTNPAGKQVEGDLSADGTTWTASEPLGYGKTYTWSGSALGEDGARVPVTGEFTTLTPARRIGVRLNVGDDRTYGIAMPVVVTFDAAVPDRAAAERALRVETSVPTEGSWAWLTDRKAHWRPKEYWKPHTEVTVAAEVYGIDLGDGAYGSADVTASFAIGRAQVVKADTRSHRLVVIRDGKQVQHFPASYGLESDPGRVTRSGIHVVMSRHTSYSMSNPQYDYENVVVPWAVRISNNGEFIHGYADSIWAQGKQNVSHGCINLSPANAKVYFDSVLTGDPVEVTGSTVDLGPQDHDFYDWTVSWEKWRSLSALAG